MVVESASALPAGGERIFRFLDVTEEYLNTATPDRGAITYAIGYQAAGHQAEIDMANWLFHVFGGDICLLTEVNLDRVSTADYLWRGTFWELKTVTTEKSANGAIRHGLKQIYENPGGIILDYRGHKIKLETLQDVIRKRLWWVENHPSLDVMIILDEDHVKVWRYPKEE